nr:lipocalin-like domain-containing protein [uncultured Chitinophaga sp.]
MKTFIGKHLIGAWRLIGCTDEDQHGNTLQFFGASPTGMLIYDDKGNMSVQMMKQERHLFASVAVGIGTPEETYDAFHGYNAYYGRYAEETPGEILHIVEGSLFPNFIGIRFIRYAELRDDELILVTPPMLVKDRQVVFRLVWKRI